MNRCTGITHKGIQCSRLTPGRFCCQHDGSRLKKLLNATTNCAVEAIGFAGTSGAALKCLCYQCGHSSEFRVDKAVIRDSSILVINCFQLGNGTCESCNCCYPLNRFPNYPNATKIVFTTDQVGVTIFYSGKLAKLTAEGTDPSIVVFDVPKREINLAWHPKTTRKDDTLKVITSRLDLESLEEAFKHKTSNPKRKPQFQKSCVDDDESRKQLNDLIRERGYGMIRLPKSVQNDYVLKVEELKDGVWVHREFLDKSFLSVQEVTDYCKGKFTSSSLNQNLRYVTCVKDSIFYDHVRK